MRRRGQRGRSLALEGYVERTLSSSMTRQTKVSLPILVFGIVLVGSTYLMQRNWFLRPMFAFSFTLVVVFLAFLRFWWSGNWRLADSVVEVPAGLRVRRGRRDVLITFREIAEVGHGSLDGQSVCVLDLHAAGPLGARIEFLAIPDDEGERLLGMDLWEYLEIQVARAERGR
jgi:hypothetical protein